MMRFKMRAVAGIIAGLALLGVAQAQEPPRVTEDRPRAPAASPASAPAQSQPAGGVDDPQVERILNRLEERDIRDVSARVIWKRAFLADLGSPPDELLGVIQYRDSRPTPKFIVAFETLIEGGRKRPLVEKHLFDGEYYVHMQGRNNVNTITRTQVRRPDDKSNPFRIGEGQFPIPWGQRKADILREYEVKLMEPAKGDPPDTDRLRLTPRRTSRSYDRYQWIDFWIARGGDAAGLPVQVRVAELDGTGMLNSELTVSFEAPRFNTGVADSVFKIEKPDSSWSEEIVPLPEQPPERKEVDK